MNHVVPNGKKNEDLHSEGIKFGAEIQSAVKAELNNMLSAPFFAQSARCKRFLSHIVLHTLSGNAGQLKERTIGISVFERAIDYNTGEDAIVRVTANEVRKRIGQFYQESRAVHPIQIDLPRGTYVPEFRIHSTSRGNEYAETNVPVSTHREFAAGEQSLASEISLTSAPESGSNHSHESQLMTASSVPPRRRGDWRLWLSFALLPLVLAILAVLGVLGRVGMRNPVPDVWNAFTQAKSPVLVCLGTHDLPIAIPKSAGKTEDVVMRTETIPIDDATVVASMARVLGNKGIPFRLAAAETTTLEELQAHPVILIGAVDNKWTVQLTQALRYRIRVTFPLGPDKPPAASIVDAEHSSAAPWTIDFSIPLSEWKSDYAIVARENDTTIGVPVLIEAGLGNEGSLAASKFMASGALTSALGNEPSCRGKSNFEIVIGTDMIDTSPGPAHILRLACW